MKKVKNKNTVRWIIACFLAALSLGAIQDKGAGIISFIFLLISAFIVSPISDNVTFLKKFFDKYKPLKIIVPILLFFIAIAIAPDNEDSSQNKDKTVPATANTEITTYNSDINVNTTSTTDNVRITTSKCSTTTKSVTTSTTSNIKTTTSTNSTTIATTTQPATTSITVAPTTQPETEPPTPEPTIQATEPPVFIMNYVLNTNTMKAHTTHCGEVRKIKAENKQEYSGTSEELISYGYSPCGRCKPW